MADRSNGNPGAGRPEPLRTTLLALVLQLQEDTAEEEQVIRTAAEWIRTGRAVLTGNFAGERCFELD